MTLTRTTSLLVLRRVVCTILAQTTIDRFRISQFEGWRQVRIPYANPSPVLSFCLISPQQS